MKTIAIVTVNFNTAYDTNMFLKSLDHVKTSGFNLFTIIVDNGSKEHFHLQENKDDVILIRIDDNTGFTGGYNRGIQEALQRNADYVLAINNDTILDPAMIEELLTVYETHDKVGIVVPKIYFAKGHEFHKDRYRQDELGKVFWYAGGYFDWANIQSVHRGVDEVDYGQYDKTEETGFITGCCMLIKREVLEKVGMFDEHFFLYYEDADLCCRVIRAGYKLYYAPKAILQHINASSSGGAGNILQDYFITRNQMLFGMRYAPLKSKFALLRQSIRLLSTGRPMQKKALQDYYKRNFGKGSFFEK
jgi:GT2 family glycosyltransferase